MTKQTWYPVGWTNRTRTRGHTACSHLLLIDQHGQTKFACGTRGPAKGNMLSYIPSIETACSHCHYSPHARTYAVVDRLKGQP